MAKRLEVKKAEVEKRRREYESLTLEERLQRAIERGHENTKEATKLREKIKKQQNQNTGKKKKHE